MATVLHNILILFVLCAVSLVSGETKILVLPIGNVMVNSTTGPGFTLYKMKVPQIAKYLNIETMEFLAGTEVGRENITIRFLNITMKACDKWSKVDDFTMQVLKNSNKSGTGDDEMTKQEELMLEVTEQILAWREVHKEMVTNCTDLSKLTPIDRAKNMIVDLFEADEEFLAKGKFNSGQLDKIKVTKGDNYTIYTMPGPEMKDREYLKVGTLELIDQKGNATLSLLNVTVTACGVTKKVDDFFRVEMKKDTDDKLFFNLQYAFGTSHVWYGHYRELLATCTPTSATNDDTDEKTAVAGFLLELSHLEGKDGRQRATWLD